MTEVDLTTMCTIAVTRLDLDALFRLETRDDAARWFDAAVEAVFRTTGAPRQTAAGMLREALGVISGDLDIEYARKLYALLDVVHPILGTPDERSSYSTFDLMQIATSLADVKHGFVTIQA